MKKDPTKLKGNATERRFLKIAKAAKTHVSRVERAPLKLDRAGIDAIVHTHNVDGQGSIQIPVQVKSSWLGVIKHERRYPNHMRAGVICIVVGNLQSNAEISQTLCSAIEHIQEQKMNFTQFLVPRRRFRKKTQVRLHALSGQKKQLLQNIRREETELELQMFQ